MPWSRTCVATTRTPAGSTPASSSDSRNAPATGSSPGLSAPPGTPQVPPWSLQSARCWSRTCTVGASGAGRGAAPDAPAVQVLLQHRALWSDQGGTWGVPGDGILTGPQRTAGALRPGEDPVAGALRESEEEAGADPG